MIYIKLTQDRDLIITVGGAIYRGENLNQKICFMIPAVLGDVDILTSTVELHYVCPGQTVERVKLERFEEMHSDYCQYRIPVTTDLTKDAGNLIIWLNITADGEVLAKSGKCLLHVITDSIEKSTDGDDLIIDDFGAILYTRPQALVDSEQQQALENIGLDEDAVHRALEAADMLVKGQR